MLFQKDDTATGTRSIAFVIGGALAFALFAVFAWDLRHHGAGYSPVSPRAPASPLVRLLGGLGGSFWLFHSLGSAVASWRKRAAKAKAKERAEEAGPERTSLSGPHRLENAGATEAHRSESASADFRR